MKVSVEVDNLPDVVAVSGISQQGLAEVFDHESSYMSLKVRGIRPWFVDELPRLALALRTRGTRAVDITVAQLAKLLGPALRDKRYAKRRRRATARVPEGTGKGVRDGRGEAASG